MNIKKKLRSAYRKEAGNTPSFLSFAELADLEKPIRSPRPLFLKRAVAVGLVVAFSVVLVPSALILSMMLRTETNYRTNAASFTKREADAAEDKTFKALNSIEYSDAQENLDLNDDFVSDVSSFADDVFSLLSDSDKFFSPLGLYGVLDMASPAGSEETVSSLNDLLSPSGLDIDTRGAEMGKALRNNYFANSEYDYDDQTREIFGRGTVQMRQAAFFNETFGANPSYVEDLTPRRAEAYEGSFEDQEYIDYMLSWINSAFDTPMVDEKGLNINYNTALYLFSTLYFENFWADHFREEDTSEKTFYLKDGSEKTVSFMEHDTNAKVYRYDTGSESAYFSLYDYFETGYAVQYLSPENDGADILEILSAKKEADPTFNFLLGETIGREDLGLDYNSEEANPSFRLLTLSIPKFSRQGEIDFLPYLKDESLGISSIFDVNKNSFPNAFTELEENDKSWLDRLSQTNDVTFDEDGTKVQSLTIGSIGAGSAAPYQGDYVILERPFVYVIRDPNNLPIFMGYMADPTL